MYFRFTLSIRDVEALTAERGVVVSRKTIPCWVIKYGRLIAANLRRGRPLPTGRGRFLLFQPCLRIQGAQQRVLFDEAQQQLKGLVALLSN